MLAVAGTRSVRSTAPVRPRAPESDVRRDRIKLMVEQASEMVGWKTIASSVAAALRADISAGRIGAGERLRQNEIASRFNVSTTPVREALGILERQGLVRIDPQRGATVFLPTEDDLREHYEIRIALERLAVAKAAERFTDDDAERAAEVLAQLRQCRDSARELTLNSEFHGMIYAVSGRARLIEMIAGLRTASDAYLHIYAFSVKLPSRQIDAEHTEILAACEARDPVRAAAAVEAHLQHTVAHVARELASRPDD